MRSVLLAALLLAACGGNGGAIMDFGVDAAECTAAQAAQARRCVDPLGHSCLHAGAEAAICTVMVPCIDTVDDDGGTRSFYCVPDCSTFALSPNGTCH